MKKFLTCTTFIVALTASLPAFAQNDDDMKSEKSSEKTREYKALKTSKYAKKSSYDLQFVDTMIAHHRQSVEMSEIAMERSQNTDVKELAEKMATNHEADISKLESIRSNLDDDAAKSVNLGLDGMSAVDLTKLDAQKPKTFDEKYLKESLMHAEGGLKMSRDAAKRAKNREVREVAGELAGKYPEQIKEIKEMMKKID